MTTNFNKNVVKNLMLPVYFLFSQVKTSPRVCYIVNLLGGIIRIYERGLALLTKKRRVHLQSLKINFYKSRKLTSDL